MLQRSTKKEVRLRSLKFKGGNFEAPRPEEEDTLPAEFTPLASPALRLVYCLNTFVPLHEATRTVAGGSCNGCTLSTSSW